MKARTHALLLSLMAGVAAWLLDALIARTLLDGAGFLDCLILDLSPADWIRRIAVLFLFTALGIILSKKPEEHEAEQEAVPVGALDFGQFTYQAQVMMLGLDIDGNINLFNRRCEEATQYSAEEILGANFFDHLLPTRALPDMHPAFKAVVKKGSVLRREVAWLTNRGVEIVVNCHLAPVHDASGEIVGAVVVGEEVTEYRLSAAELLLSRKPWRPLAETVMGDGMAAVETDGSLSWVSESLAETLGYDREALIGEPLAQVAAEHDRERLSEMLVAVFAERISANESFTACTAVGGVLPVQIALQPTEDPEGEPAGAFAIIRDLTAIKQTESEASAARRSTEAGLERLREQMQNVEERIHNAQMDARAKHEETLADLRQQVAEADRRIEEARESSREAAEAQLRELSVRLEEAEQAAADAKNAAHAQYFAEIERLRQQLVAAQQSAEEMATAARADEEARVAELREALSEAEKGLSAQTREAQELQAQLADMQERMDDLQTSSSDEIASLAAEVQEAHNRVAEVERDAEKRLDELREAALTERQETIAKLTAKLKAAEAQVGKAREAGLAEGEEEIMSLRADLETARERMAQVEEDAEKRLDELRGAALTERQEAISRLTERLKAAEAQVGKARERAQREFTSQLFGMSARVTKAEDAVAAAREAALAEKREEMERLRRQFETAQAEANEAAVDAENARQAAEALQNQLAEARKQVSEVAQLAEVSGNEVEKLRVQLAAARKEADAAGQDASNAQRDVREQLEVFQARVESASDEAAAAMEREAAESERADALAQQLDRAVASEKQTRIEAQANGQEAAELRAHLAGMTEQLAAAGDAEAAGREEMAALQRRLSVATQRADEAEASRIEQQRRAEELAAKLEDARGRTDEEHAQNVARVAELEQQLHSADDEAALARQEAERQREMLTQEIQSVRSQAAEQERELQAEVARISGELAMVRDEADEVRGGAETQRRQVVALREQVQVAEKSAEEACAARSDGEARIAQLTRELSEVEVDARRRIAEAAEQHQHEVDELTRQLFGAAEQVDRIHAEAEARVEGARKAALAQRQEEFDELSGQLVAAEARVEEVRRELTAAHKERLAELQAELKRVEARAENAREQALREQQMVIDGLRTELAEAEDIAKAAREEATAHVEQARLDVLAEHAAEVQNITDQLRLAEARAEEIAGEARHEYARMLARMSERVASIEHAAGAEQEAALASQQEKIAQLREELEATERRAADARRLAREEYEGEIARSLAEAASAGERIEEVRRETREEFQQENVRLEQQLKEALREGDEERRQVVASLEFLRALLDGVPSPVFFADTAGRYQSCNTAFARNVLGLSRAEVLGRTPEDLHDRVPEELLEQLRMYTGEVIESCEEIAWEARVHGPDGGLRSWAFRKEPYLEDGEVAGIIAAMIDISGLEVAQRELEQQRAHSATVLERAPVVMAEIHPEGTVSAVYGDSMELLGWSAEELRGRDWWATLFPRDLGAPIRDVVGALRSGGDLEDHALRLRTKSGEERVLSWSTSNVRSAERELLSILMVGCDITERAREEETLELHFREAVERVKKYRCLSNALRLTQDANLSLVEILSGIVASLPEAWRYPGITTACGSVWGRVRSFGEAPYEPVASMSADVVVSGEVVGEITVRYHEERADMSEGPFTLEERELLDSIASHLGNMIERRSTEESLAKLQAFRHTLIDQASLWLMALDRDRNVVLWNRAAERVSGYARKDVIGNDRVWELLFPDADYCGKVLGRLTEIAFGGRPAEDWETIIRTRDGTDRLVSWYAHRLIDDDGSTLGIVAFGRDVTEHRAVASNT